MHPELQPLQETEILHFRGARVFDFTEAGIFQPLLSCSLQVGRENPVSCSLQRDDPGGTVFSQDILEQSFLLMQSSLLQVIFQSLQACLQHRALDLPTLRFGSWQRQ